MNSPEKSLGAQLTRLIVLTTLVDPRSQTSDWSFNDLIIDQKPWCFLSTMRNEAPKEKKNETAFLVLTPIKYAYLQDTQ